jgi:hypothetical protein
VNYPIYPNEGLLPGTLVWRKDVHIGLVDHYGVVLSLEPFNIASPAVKWFRRRRDLSQKEIDDK